jgi:hypothetical protein
LPEALKLLTKEIPELVETPSKVLDGYLAESRPCHKDRDRIHIHADHAGAHAESLI